MRVLVIGQGGRESAIVRALHFSPSVLAIHALPGNVGIKKMALCHDISSTDHPAILKLIKNLDLNLVIVGPEVPLSEGLSDYLRTHDVTVFGPSKEGAQLESSKIFCKEFLIEAKIPTANYFKVSSVEDVLKYCDRFSEPWVLKADGLASGKGVFIVKTKNELVQCAQSLFNEKKLGDAGSVALLEEHMPGSELSYLILTNGTDYEPLPMSQDHKRLMNNDEGPNTGGMGAIAPIHIDPAIEDAIKTQIVEPFLKLLKEKNTLYRGVVYFGIMVTPKGPKVLEINVRFGDPEAQVLLPLLDGEWGKVFMEIAKGNLPKLKWKQISAACVVMAANGYPDAPSKGDIIEGNIFAETTSSYFIHAGIDLNKSRDYVTYGGRVLGAVGLGSKLSEAIQNSYLLVQKVKWPGIQYRKDIGSKF